MLSHRATAGIGSFNTSQAINHNQTKVTERTIMAVIDLRRAANIDGLSPKWRASKAFAPT